MNFSTAVDYLEGRLPLEAFIKEAIKDESIFDSLQSLVSKDAQRDIQTFEGDVLITKRVAYNVRNIILEYYNNPTLANRVNIFAEVRDLLLVKFPDIKVEEAILKKYRFILANTPPYIGGVEAEVVLEKIYDSLSLPPKANLYRTIVKQKFVYLNKPPRWIQEPEWPIGKSDTPYIFVSEKKASNEKIYIFSNAASDETFVVRQAF